MMYLLFIVEILNFCMCTKLSRSAIWAQEARCFTRWPNCDDTHGTMSSSKINNLDDKNKPLCIIAVNLQKSFFCNKAPFYINESGLNMKLIVRFWPYFIEAHFVSNYLLYLEGYRVGL